MRERERCAALLVCTAIILSSLACLPCLLLCALLCSLSPAPRLVKELFLGSASLHSGRVWLCIWCRRILTTAVLAATQQPRCLLGSKSCCPLRVTTCLLSGRTARQHSLDRSSSVGQHFWRTRAASVKRESAQRSLLCKSAASRRNHAKVSQAGAVLATCQALVALSWSPGLPAQF